MSDIDLDAIEARCRDWRDYHAGKELVLALIARVREQEQEIARLNDLVKEWEAWGASDGGYSRKWDGLDFGGGRGLP